MSRSARRSIAVITGSRAEYGLLRSTIRALRNRSDVEVRVVACGMHLLRRQGHTVDEIRADRIEPAACIRMQKGDESAGDQAAGLARGVRGIADFLVKRRCDIVLVLGDRIEAMAGALAAVTTGRCLAHVHGGDRALGDFDDSLRHAISKLAHVHFAASRRSRERLIRMGERPRTVCIVGAPGLDELRPVLKAHGKQPVRRDALIVYHAHGRPPERERRTALAIFEAAAAAGLRRIIIGPNSDRGQSGVWQAIDEHRRNHRRSADVEVQRSLPRSEFLCALVRSAVLLGNSSSALIEAPYAGTPAVVVGDRQAGREPGASGVIPCGENASQIRMALSRALRLQLKRGRRTAYGDGHAGERIAERLSTIPLTARLLRKQIAY